MSSTHLDRSSTLSPLAEVVSPGPCHTPGVIDRSIPRVPESPRNQRYLPVETVGRDRILGTFRRSAEA